MVQAVFDRIGDLYAGHLEAVAFRERVGQNRALPVGTVKIIKAFLREWIHKGGRIHCMGLKVRANSRAGPAGPELPAGVKLKTAPQACASSAIFVPPDNAL